MGSVWEFNEIFDMKVGKFRTQSYFSVWSCYGENKVGVQELLKRNISNIPCKSKCFISDLKRTFLWSILEMKYDFKPRSRCSWCGGMWTKSFHLPLHCNLRAKASQQSKQKVSLWMKRNLIPWRMLIFTFSCLLWMGKVCDLSSKNCFYIQQIYWAQTIYVL